MPHALLVVTVLPLLAALTLAGRLAYPHVLRPAAAAASLVLIDSAIGAIVALDGRPAWARGLHLAVAALAFAATLAAAAACHRGEPLPAGRWRDYVALTKPRIMTLLLLTAAAGMFAGARGVPPLGKLAALLAGGALASGGASALNHLLDRDLDAQMGRTAQRPVAAGRVAPPRALELGLVLSACSFVLLASVVNLLTAALAMVGTLGYVLVYTRWLKRTTPQNIVIGGAAGAMPPLVGWAAARGNLTLPALFLFLIMLCWTPPHFWALALLIKQGLRRRWDPDAARRARGARDDAPDPALRVALAAATLLPSCGTAPAWPYLGAAVVLDACLIALALALRRARHAPRARGRLFHFSLLYLALLFAALAIDPLLV